MPEPRCFYATEKIAPKKLSPIAILWVIPVSMFVFAGFIVGCIVSPLISGFICGRRVTFNYFEFEKLEKGDDA